MQIESIKAYGHPALGIATPAIRRGGEVLVHSRDVASALDYPRATEVLNMVEEYGVVVTVERPDLGLPGGRPMKFLTEEGVYLAAMRARTPKARKLQKAMAKKLVKVAKQ